MKTLSKPVSLLIFCLIVASLLSACGDNIEATASVPQAALIPPTATVNPTSTVIPSPTVAATATSIPATIAATATVALPRTIKAVTPTVRNKPTVVSNPQGTTPTEQTGSIQLATAGPAATPTIKPVDNGPAIGQMTTFPLPGYTYDTRITAGSDGNIWFNEAKANKIGRITPAGVVTEYNLPSPDSLPKNIISGPDGNLWFLEAGPNKSVRLGKITVTGKVTEFNLPFNPTCIAVGPDSNIWVAEDNTIGKVSPSGSFTQTSIVDHIAIFGMTTGSDGKLWYYNDLHDNFGRLEPDGTVTKFKVGGEFDELKGIANGADGNIWSNDTENKQFIRVTPGGEITKFPVETTPDMMSIGTDGYIWYTSYDEQKVGRINMQGVSTEIDTKDTPSAITPGADGNMWVVFTEGKIGKIEIKH